MSPCRRRERSAGAALHVLPSDQCACLFECLAGALRSLRLWLPSLRAIQGLNEQEGHAWSDLTERLLARLQQRLLVPAFRERLLGVDQRSLKNLCEAHPYYAALVCVERFGPDAHDLSLILAHCWRSALGQYTLIKFYQHAAIGRALRALYDDHGARPRVDVTLEADDREVAAALGAAEVGVDSITKTHLEILQRLLRRDFEHAERQGGGGGGAGGGGPMRGLRRVQDQAVLDEIGIDPEQPAEEFSPRLDFRAEARTMRPDGVDYETEHRGLAPGDLGDTQLYASVPAQACQSLAQRLDRLRKQVDARAIAADIAMRAQPLGHRWELATPAELGVFFHDLERLLQGGSEERPAAINRHLAVLLMTMLSRGLEPERVLACRFAVAAANDTPPAETGDVLVARVRARGKPTQPDDWTWDTRAKLVVGGRVQNEQLVRPTQDRLRLPLDPPLAGFYARALAEELTDCSPGVSVPLVRRSKRVLEALSAWCSDVNHRRGTRLTVHRISHFLPWRAAAARDLDPVMVAYVRGQSDMASATQAYYQYCDPAILRGNLSRFWREVILEGTDQAPAWLRIPWPPQTELALEGGEPGLGSQKVPTRDAIRKIVSWLRHHLTETTKPLSTGSDGFARVHNAYTLYTLHYLLWTLGARAVREPIPDLRYVHARHNLVLMCDKSADDLYSTRLVWATDDFLEHLGHYAVHLDRLAERRLLHHPDDYDRHLRSVARWRGGTESGPPEDGLPSLFMDLIDGELRALPAETATGGRMPRELRLPANCSRHYLRTYLVQAGCPNDLIDAQLGHWHHGREPWGLSSSLAPLRFAQTMRRYLGDLTRELGFVPIPSPLLQRGKNRV